MPVRSGPFEPRHPPSRESWNRFSRLLRSLSFSSIKVFFSSLLFFFWVTCLAGVLLFDSLQGLPTVGRVGYVMTPPIHFREKAFPFSSQIFLLFIPLVPVFLFPRSLNLNECRRRSFVELENEEALPLFQRTTFQVDAFFACFFLQSDCHNGPHCPWYISPA